MQANYGLREQLTIAGVPVGLEILDHMPLEKGHTQSDEEGSIIVVIATDAPLLPHQLRRLAKRAPLGIAKVGGIGGNGSGDIFISFSTANPFAFNDSEIRDISMLPNELMNDLFQATIQAVEESILNALIAARTMTGVDGNTVYEIPHERLRLVLRKYNRLVQA